MAKKILRCFAPDGASVCEGEFDTIKEAWERSADMGSRWFFYPLHVVTGKRWILDTPDDLKHFVGRSIKTLSKALETGYGQEICDWMNGQMPCPI